jgi:hypothetical protein
MRVTSTHMEKGTSRGFKIMLAILLAVIFLQLLFQTVEERSLLPADNGESVQPQPSEKERDEAARKAELEQKFRSISRWNYKEMQEARFEYSGHERALEASTNVIRKRLGHPRELIFPGFSDTPNNSMSVVRISKNQYRVSSFVLTPDKVHYYDCTMNWNEKIWQQVKTTIWSSHRRMENGRGQVVIAGYIYRHSNVTL